MHPDIRTLLAWWDRELEPRKSARVSRHMKDCSDCRERLDEAVVDLDRFLAEGGSGLLGLPIADQQALARLLEAARVRAAAAGTSPTGGRFEQLQACVRETMEAYFGRPAAERFAGAHGEADAEDLMHAAEELFSAYMGRQAAAAVMTDILNGGTRRCA